MSQIWCMCFKQVKVPPDKTALEVRVIGPFDKAEEVPLLRAIFNLDGDDVPDGIWVCDREPVTAQIRETVEAGLPLGSLSCTRRLAVRPGALDPS